MMKKYLKKGKRTVPLMALLLAIVLLCSGCASPAINPAAETDQTAITEVKQAKEPTATAADDKDKTAEETKGEQEKEPLKTEEKAPEQIDTGKKAAEEAKKIAEEKEKKKAEEEARKKAEEEAQNIGMEIDQSTEKDQYQTDPVPEGKPVPVEPQEVEIDTSSALQCTFSIRCDTILNNMEQCEEAKKSIVPQNGTILPTQTVTFSSGESVYDVLLRVCKSNGIHMEASWTPIYNSAYIEGIANLYEFDVGDLSGWMYKVNGWFPNYGCSRYSLADGDIVEWVYTCDLGYDVGGGYATDG